MQPKCSKPPKAFHHTEQKTWALHRGLQGCAWSCPDPNSHSNHPGLPHPPPHHTRVPVSDPRTVPLHWNALPPAPCSAHILMEPSLTSQLTDFIYLFQAGLPSLSSSSTGARPRPSVRRCQGELWRTVGPGLASICRRKEGKL